MVVKIDKKNEKETNPLVTRAEALPLSYRSLVGAKALNYFRFI